MIEFYKDRQKKTLDPLLFSSVAEDWASKVYKSGERERDKNKRSQLRKFYDEVLRLNALAKMSPGDWDDIHPYVNMLIAKVVYARGRNKVTREFEDMLKYCISHVQEDKDLDVFANFFEAFMGFYRQYGEN